VTGGANALKTKAQLEAEYDLERIGAYSRAYEAGDQPIWPRGHGRRDDTRIAAVRGQWPPSYHKPSVTFRLSRMSRARVTLESTT
jgi:hypothetical protein